MLATPPINSPGKAYSGPRLRHFTATLMTTSFRSYPHTPKNKWARTIRRWHPLLSACLAVGLAVTAAGNGGVRPLEQEGAGNGIVVSRKLGDDELVIEEVFQSHLPTTLEKYGLRLSVNPHLGDWENKDHMRLTTTVRYGLTENCEISVGSNLYFSHGHGNIRAFDDYGAASLKLGAKLNLGQPLFAGWETGVGLDYEFPTGRPPPELTDGLRHLRPYVTSSHRLASHPDLRIFVGLRFDNVSHTSLPGEFAKNAFHEGSTGVTGGFVIDRGHLHYTLEASYDTTSWIGHSHDDIYSLRPGLLWEIPQWRDRSLRSNWVIGFALNDTYGPGGNSLGASFKLRYNRDLKASSPGRPVPRAP